MHDLLSLADAHLAGTASPADVRRLETLLAASAAARRTYLSLALVHAQLGATVAALPTRAGHEPSRARSRPSRWPARGGPRPTPARVAATALAWGLAVGAVALMLAAPRPLPGPPGAGGGYYPPRTLSLSAVAVLDGGDATAPAGAVPRPLPPTTLRPRATTHLRAHGGADVSLDGASVFGIVTRDGGTLYEGGMQARLTQPAATFSVTTANLRIVDRGTAFRVDRVDGDHVTVTVLDGEVEVQSRVRLPVAWWPFEPGGAAGPANAAGLPLDDVMAGLGCSAGHGVAACAGLVGAGALRFDGTPSAHVRIVGGTGDVVGSGLLAVAEGISIEAVITPEWSGRELDYDEIYRKDDGDYRVLLSFQNDGTRNTAFTDPPVAPGPCLSFGLHLAGIGYRELDMPLDGRAGRPTLAELRDGRAHHVVATFDSFTGTKALFIDGTLRFAHDYPVGTLVLAGGPAAAEIGSHRGAENFAGVIDEVALYDFALAADEVAEHRRRAVAGEPPVGVAPPAVGAPRWRSVTRIRAGETMTFNQRTGLPR
jgi:hypothetical protein